ncbi:MAG: hypothetical protein ACD_13C00134G0001 [uncultured bacterium]|nr:MAG: hypothetical protein ACD_13C00134G0001 [uncultured bacterium]
MRKVRNKFTYSEERKNQRKAVLFIFLTLASLAILYFLGIPLLGRLATLVSSLKGNNQQISSSDITPPPPPKFRNFPEFTNQQRLDIHGNTEAGATVKLTLNGAEQEILADASGQFSFSLNLEDGENIFAAIAIDQSGNQSQKSDDHKITLDKKVPDLEITTPSDGASFFGSEQRQVTLGGKTETGAAVTINDRIIAVDEDGTFQYTTTLNEGGNTFNIKCTDQAGNTTEKTITLNFTP